MSFEVIDDADTGQEILWFMRRGRAYLYLRDATTKAFVKMLIGVELRYFMVVDYDEERAKKGNPLYVDAVGVYALSPDAFPEREGYEEGLKAKVSGKVAQYFGHYVADDILDEAGLEYGSEVREGLTHKVVIKRIVRGRERLIVRVAVNPNLWYWVLVWKHHPRDSPMSEEGYAVY